MGNKILITGAAGFIGGFLVDRCLRDGCNVLGLDIIEPSRVWSNGAFELCDVRDSERLAALAESFQPQRVYHLAAQSYPTVSMERPRDTIETNVSGTVNLFESLRAANMKPPVVVACSSAEYGLVTDEDLPVREDHPLRPLHPYGVSKVAQDLLAAQYFANYDMPAVRVRIFNTTGPGKVGDVCSDLTRRAIEIELGIRQSPMVVGNLTTRRALVDVRDMVRALSLAAEHGEPGEVYNVGGSDIYTAQDVIDALREFVPARFSIQQDPALLRTRDEPVIAGDTTKFHIRTGWEPEITLRQTLREMADWWRERLAAGQAPLPDAISH